MKGIIFNLLEDFIIENYGDEIYDEIFSECNLKTKEPFVGPETYPDEDLFEIVDKTTKKLGISLDDALKIFGKFIIPKLAEKFPEFFNRHNNPKDFLKTIDDIHYIEVMKLFIDATPPRFIISEPSLGSLIISYKSKRKLYSLVEGLIEGVGEHYTTSIKQSFEIQKSGNEEIGVFTLIIIN